MVLGAAVLGCVVGGCVAAGLLISVFARISAGVSIPGSFGNPLAAWSMFLWNRANFFSATSCGSDGLGRFCISVCSCDSVIRAVPLIALVKLIIEPHAAM